MTAIAELIPSWAAGHVATTRQAYRRDVDQLVDWLDGRTLEEIDRTTAQTWINHLQDLGLADKTVQRKRSAASSLFTYAIQEEVWTKANPFGLVRVPKGGSAAKAGLSIDEAELLIDTAADEGPAAHALIALLVTTGCRISGACGAQIGDLSSDQGHPVVRIRLKGGGDQRIPLSPRTIRAIAFAVDDRTSGAIFMNPRSGRPLNRATGGRWVTRIAAKAGISIRVTPHTLRHTAASILAGQGVDPIKIQQLLGHRSIETTMNYVHLVASLEDSPVHLLDQLLMGDDEEDKS